VEAENAKVEISARYNEEMRGWKMQEWKVGNIGTILLV